MIVRKYSLTSLTTLFVMMCLLVAPTHQAFAADCGAAARRVVQSTGGQLLSAVPTSDGSTCKVSVFIPSKGGQPPQKVTREVPAD